MIQRNNTILIATDFKEQSLIAFEYSFYFAQLSGCSIDLLHVVDGGDSLLSKFADNQLQEKVAQEATKLMENLAAKYKNEVKINFHVKIGKVYEQIKVLAEELKPLFILTGRTEDPGFIKKLLGSNSFQLINNCKFPIITVRGKQKIQELKEKNKDIIVPLDFQKETSDQITAAIEFGKKFNSVVKIISILDDDSISKELSIIKGMNKAKKLVESHGVVCITELIKAPDVAIHQSILEYAKKENAHLIIIMTHEELTTLDYFIGHTAREILDSADIPVLTVLPWLDTDESVFGFVVDPLGIFK